MKILVLAGKNSGAEVADILPEGHDYTVVRQAVVSRGVRRLEGSGAECVLLVPAPGDTSWSRAVVRIRSEYGLHTILVCGEDGVQDKAYSLGVHDCFGVNGETRRSLRRSLRHLEEILDLENRMVRARNRLEWMEQTDRFGSWDVDAEGVFRLSEGLRLMLGVETSDVPARFEGLRNFVHPEDHEIFDRANEATFDQGWPLDFEYRMVAADGKVRHVHANREVELDSGGRVARAWGMVRDISLRKDFEDLLFRRDAILQVLTVFASRFLQDPDWEEGLDKALSEMGRATDVTRVYLFSREDGKEDLLNLNHWWSAEGVLSLEDKPEIREQDLSVRFTRWKTAMLRRKVIAGHVKDFSREERAVFGAAGAKSVLIVPVFAGPRWWGILGLSEHRSERDWLPVEIESIRLAANIFGSAIHYTTMAEKLRKANRTAEEASSAALEANMAKSMFLANMSHEIRTPISGILGMAEMLVTTGLNPVQREHVDMVRDASNALLAIVNDVLDISKIEAGKMELQPEDFDFRRELKTCVRSFGPQAAVQGVVFRYTVDEEVPRTVSGDPARLGQVLRNLIGNALKFTAQGLVELHVTLSRRENGRVCLLFRVSDTGEGIAEDKLGSIFDVFIQADSSLRKKHQGTGLGLAICRELVHMMGGEIGVESEPGKGSTFQFTAWFDKAAGEVVPIKPGSTSVPKALHLNILLAEDNPMNRKYLTHFLTMFGHTVVTAENGVEALSVLEAKGREIDLVLMDIQMPEMSGIEATRAIRKSDGRYFDRGITVIALTAYAMKGDRERMLEAGMDNYVSKPVDMQELSAVIARCVCGPGGSGKSAKEGLEARACPAPELASQAIDMDALHERFQGNTELLKDILDLFLMEASEKLEQLDRSIEAMDAKEVGATLHSITNIATHVLAMDVVRRTQAMEKRCYLGELDVVVKEVEELKPRLAALVRGVEDVVRKL